MNEDCVTHLLSDSATDQDEFGVHSEIAAVLARLIADSSHGSACLLGEWGSGKSSLIRMLPSAIDGHKCESLIFVFDAWTHQGDPLRRVFLSSLSEAMVRKRWLDRQTLRRLRKLLSGVEKTTFTEHRTRLKPVGLAVILLTTLCAFLVAVITSVFRFADSMYFPMLLGLQICFGVTPVAFTLIMYNWMKHKARTSDSEDGGESSDDVLAAFVAKPPMEIKTRTYEPTQMDTHRFQRLFNMLGNRALDGNAGRRLVVVIDNLDRVPPEVAHDVWATMQVFVSGDSSQDSDRAPSWLIVPIAEEAAEGLWPSSSERQESSHSMLSKTFEIRLDVPRLVRSDFTRYLSERFCESLPDHVADAQDVVRVYDRLRPGTIWRTPRESKRFLNELVVVHRQWGHRLPICTQALYVIARNEREPLEDSIGGTVDRGPLLRDPSWRENLAAMAYGVEPATATQLFLKPKVLSAIDHGPVTGLKSVQHIPGFWESVADIVAERSLGGEFNSVQDLARAFAGLIQWPEMSTSPVFDEVMRSLGRGIGLCTQWTPSTADAHAIAMIAMHSLQPMECVRHLLALASTRDALADGPDQWAGCIDELLHRLPVNLSRSARLDLRMPGEVNERMSLISSFAFDTRMVPREVLVSGLSAEQVADHYWTMITEAGPSEHEEFRIQVLAQADLVDPDSIALALSTRFRQSDGYRLDELTAACRLMELTVRLGADFSSAMKGVAASGDLSFWANEARVASDVPAEAAILMLALRLVDSGVKWQEWPAVGQSSEVFVALDAALPDGALGSEIAKLACLIRREPNVGSASEFEASLLARCLYECEPGLMSVRWWMASTRTAGDFADWSHAAAALHGRLRLVIRRPYVLSMTRLYLALSQLELSSGDRDLLDRFIVSGLRTEYSAANWVQVLTAGTATTGLLKYAVGLMDAGVSRNFVDAVVECISSATQLNQGLLASEMLIVAHRSQPELAQAAVEKRILRAMRAEEWRELAGFLVLVREYLASTGFPWSLSSAEVESIVRGLLLSKRAEEVETLLVVNANRALVRELSGKGRARIKREITRQLRNKQSRKRAAALQGVYSQFS